MSKKVFVSGDENDVLIKTPKGTFSGELLECGDNMNNEVWAIGQNCYTVDSIIDKQTLSELATKFLNTQGIEYDEIEVVFE